MDISQIRGLVLLVCALLNLMLTFIVWGRAKGNRGAFHLGFLSFFSAVYSFVFGVFFFSEWQRLLFYKLTFLGVLIIPAYLAFVYTFTENIKNFRLKVGIWYTLAIAIVLVTLLTPYIVAEVGSQYPYINESTHGPLTPYTRVYIIAGLIFSWFYLLRAQARSTGAKQKSQIKYFIYGISVYSLMGVLAAGILPLFFPKFVFIDLSAIFSFIWAGSAVYAILRGQIFDIRALLTEVLVYTFGIALLVQIFFRELAQKTIFQAVVFLLFCLMGYLLIMASRKETERSEILEEKVADRTKDLQASNQALEQSKQVAEDRAKELEKWYNLTVGRELKMAELKKQIKDMEEKTK